MSDRYPKLSEKIHSERNWLRCKADWVAHAVELEQKIETLARETNEAYTRGYADGAWEASGAINALAGFDGETIVRVRNAIYGLKPPTSEPKFIIDETRIEYTADAQAGAGGKEPRE